MNHPFKKTINHPKKNFTRAHMSPGILCDGWLFISGVGPIDMPTGKPVLGTIEEQTFLVLRNIEDVVQEAGGSKADIVECTSYLADLNDFNRYNEAYRQFFADCILPARTTTGASLLLGIKIEIKAIARIPEAK